MDSTVFTNFLDLLHKNTKYMKKKNCLHLISIKSDLENIPKIDREIGPNLFKFFNSSTNSLNLFEFSHFMQINIYSHKIPREASDTERKGQRYQRILIFFPHFLSFKWEFRFFFCPGVKDVS